MRNPDLLTQRQVADMLGIHAKTVLEYERAGKLHPTRLSKRYVRYHKSEIDAILAPAEVKR